MDRRAFIGIMVGSVFASPPTVLAQQQGKVWRIGFLYFGSRQSSLESGRYEAFVQGMRELGYVEGKNIVIEKRFGDGQAERMPSLAAELVSSKVDVIVATGSATYSALRFATTTTPIVVTVTADPVAAGLAASVARPGGNFTGLSDTASDLGPKELELLKAAVPRLSRVAVLLNPDNVTHPVQMKRLISAAQKVGIQVVLGEADVSTGIEPAFASFARDRADAAIVFNDTFFVQHFEVIAQAALRHRIPSISQIREYARADGLMSYGADLVDNFRRAAAYVDKILKGAKPGELPFEQPTRYSLAINLKTAKTLGITIPPSLLLRADEVIQ